MSAPRTQTADPLDLLDHPEIADVLKKAASTLPTSPDEVEGLLESFAIVARNTPENQSDEVKKHVQTSQFDAIAALGMETPSDERCENYKTSGNEAYKLYLRVNEELAKEKKKLEEKEQEKAKTEAEGKKLDEKQEKLLQDIKDKLEKYSASLNKRLDDAFQYYSHAIDCAPSSAHLLSQCYSNRAQIQIQWKNLNYAIEDCLKAIQVDQNNVKAHYRAAKVYAEQKKYQLAKEMAKNGQLGKYIMKIEKKELEKMEKEYEKCYEQQQEEKKKKEEEEEKKNEEKIKQNNLKKADNDKKVKELQEVIESRGLTVGEVDFKPSNTEQDNEAHSHYFAGLNAAIYSSQLRVVDGRLYWPVLFLYPLHLQSDFIQSMYEQETLFFHMQKMFPPSGDKPPWDTRDEYVNGNLSVFVDIDPVKNVKNDKYRKLLEKEEKTDEGKVRIPVNPQMTLGRILASQDLQKRGFVIPGIPSFVIIPKKRK